MQRVPDFGWVLELGRNSRSSVDVVYENWYYEKKERYWKSGQRKKLLERIPVLVIFRDRFIFRSQAET